MMYNSEFSLFEAIFKTLPERNVGYKPMFDYGNGLDVLAWQKQQRKKYNTSYYPLVWLETPFTFNETKILNKQNGTITLILATLSKSEYTNKQRVERGVEGVLIPLKDDVINALTKSGVTKVIGDVKHTIFLNYATGENENASDVWDAIKLEINLEIKTNCTIKNISYGN